MIQNIQQCPQHQGKKLRYICLDNDCGLISIRFCKHCRLLGIHTHGGKENFIKYDLFCLQLKVKEQRLSEEILQAQIFRSIIKERLDELQEYLLYINQLAKQREIKLAQFSEISKQIRYTQNMNLPEHQARRGKQFLLMPFIGDFDGLYMDLLNIINSFYGEIILDKGNKLEREYSHSIQILLIRLEKENIKQRIELSLNQQFILVVCENSIQFYNIAQNKIIQQLQINKKCIISYFDENYNKQYGLIILVPKTGELEIYNYQQNQIIFVTSFNRVQHQPIYLFKPAINSQIIKVFKLNCMYDLNPVLMTLNQAIEVPNKDGLIIHHSVDYQLRQNLFGLILDDDCFVFNYMNEQSYKFCIKFSQETNQMAVGCGMKGEILIYQIDIIKNTKAQLKCKIDKMMRFQYFEWAFDGTFIIIFLDKQCIIEYIGSIITTQITSIQHKGAQWEFFKFTSDLQRLFQLSGKTLSTYYTNDQVLLPN